MKEIIYLDTKLVNSMLAQLNTGLVIKSINESADSNSTSQGNVDSISTTSQLGGGVPLVKAALSESKTSSDTSNLVFSTSNRNLMETALDDYSLDVLIKNLDDEKIIKSESIKDGDIILKKGKLSSYNFKYLKNIFELEDLKFILPDYDQFTIDMKILKKTNKGSKNYNSLVQRIENSPWNTFVLAHSMSSYLDNLLNSGTLMKVQDCISLCESDYLRLSLPQLYFNNFSKKEVTILGIVITKNQDELSGKSQDFTEIDNFYKKSPAIISNMVLESNNIISKDDYIVRPIAIYFEY